nr:hypothetical protein CFP56_04335 [Quercus suber]
MVSIVSQHSIRCGRTYWPMMLTPDAPSNQKMLAIGLLHRISGIETIARTPYSCEAVARAKPTSSVDGQDDENRGVVAAKVGQIIVDAVLHFAEIAWFGYALEIEELADGFEVRKAVGETLAADAIKASLKAQPARDGLQRNVDACHIGLSAQVRWHGTNRSVFDRNAKTRCLCADLPYYWKCAKSEERTKQKGGHIVGRASEVDPRPPSLPSLTRTSSSSPPDQREQMKWQPKNGEAGGIGKMSSDRREKVKTEPEGPTVGISSHYLTPRSCHPHLKVCRATSPTAIRCIGISTIHRGTVHHPE